MSAQAPPASGGAPPAGAGAGAGAGAPPGGQATGGAASGPPVFTPEQIAALPHNSMGPALLATIWTLIALSGLFLALRVYCRLSRARTLWWDDGILIASWVCLLVTDILTSWLVVAINFGVHSWDFDFVNDLNKMLLPILVRGTFSITALAWSKTAFAITLLRLTDGWTKKIVWFLIITINLSLGLSALLPWVSCTPLKGAWVATEPGKKCWDQNVMLSYNIFSGAYSAAADVALALLPWSFLRSLQMKKKEKVGAGIAMSMGIFAGVAAIIKTANLHKLYADDLYDSASLMIWDVVEGAVTVIAASIPVLRVFFREAASKYRSTDDNSKNSKNGTSRFGMSSFAQTLSRKEAEKRSHATDDSRSDSSILGPDVNRPQKDHTILRTHTVTMAYGDRKKGDEAYEMRSVV